jgi:hypothetical protein
MVRINRRHVMAGTGALSVEARNHIDVIGGKVG